MCKPCWYHCYCAHVNSVNVLSPITPLVREDLESGNFNFLAKIPMTEWRDLVQNGWVCHTVCQEHPAFPVKSILECSLSNKLIFYASYFPQVMRSRDEVNIEAFLCRSIFKPKTNIMAFNTLYCLSWFLTHSWCTSGEPNPKLTFCSTNLCQFSGHYPHTVKSYVWCHLSIPLPQTYH